MTASIATRGMIAPSTPGTGGGGGGGGASGVAIPFRVFDVTTDAPATGLTFDHDEIQLSLFGATFADSLGAVTETGAGFYFYELDETEVTPDWVILLVDKAGYRADPVKLDVTSVATTDDLEDQTTLIANNLAAAQAAILAEVDTRASQTSVDDLPAAVDAQLSGTHTAGSWAGATVEEIDEALATAHGEGSWEGHSPGDIADAVLGATVEGSIQVGDTLRGLLSVLAGTTSGYDTGTIVARSIDGAKVRWTWTTDDTGRVTVTVGDLTE